MSNAKVFNPDMAVIGDFLGAAGTNTVQPAARRSRCTNPKLSFQAVVDPYARADFFISFGEEGVDLEEGFITFTALPGGLLTKVGKMRAAFGKVNTLHNHVLPWTDRPLVTQNLVGGEDGIDDAGISVARLIPNPWLFLEATGQVFRGDSGGPTLRCSSRRSAAISATSATCAAIRTSPNRRNIDLGVSYSHGHNALGIGDVADLGRFTTQLFGIDATFRWKPLQRSIYHSFVGRTRVDLEPPRSAGRPAERLGFLCLRRLSVRAALVRRRALRSVATRADDASLLDTGGSLILTYWPSEFSQVAGSSAGRTTPRAVDRQRVPVPVPVLDRRAWRASVLGFMVQGSRF